MYTSYIRTLSFSPVFWRLWWYLRGLERNTITIGTKKAGYICGQTLQRWKLFHIQKLTVCLKVLYIAWNAGCYKKQWKTYFSLNPIKITPPGYERWTQGNFFLYDWASERLISTKLTHKVKCKMQHMHKHLVWVLLCNTHNVESTFWYP